VRFPCVHAAATTPVQRPGVLLAHLTPPCQPSPEGLPGRPAHRHVRRARRSLALRPAHSRGHQFVTRYPKASDISSPPCLLRLLPAGANRRVGLAPTGKRRLVTAHTHCGPSCASRPHEARGAAGLEATRGEAWLGTGKAARFSAPVPSTARFDRLLFAAKADLSFADARARRDPGLEVAGNLANFGLARGARDARDRTVRGDLLGALAAQAR